MTEVQDPAPQHGLTEDEQLLHKLGYAQELFRAMGGFQNFAISFTIISILAGCLTSYYIAFEDLPMPASGWKDDGCDGDFNDFVFYVTGLDCEGGGVDCPTGMPGVCADETIFR